jgi:hypothetical protein
MPDPIPTPESIDADWLTEVLRSAGHRDATVRSFSSETIGTGQLGKCVRYELELAEGSGDPPRSLVGKFPSDDPASRQTGIALNNYLKEVCFYRDLASRLSIRIPRCYFSAIEGNGPDFALMLEDLAPAEQGDQISGCSVDVAAVALRELVGLHAPTWCDESLVGIDWIGAPSPAVAELTRQFYRAMLPGFVERFGPGLAADEVRIIEQVADSAGPPFSYPARPFSLVHIDYRLDNLLIDSSVSPPRVAVVDWQSITLGSPLSDVAYFLGAALRSKLRREREEELVRQYHSELRAAGVEGYDWPQCWTDYRRGVFAGFAVTVVASMLVGETERGNEMFTTMARRHARHALDLGTTEFL